MLVGAAIGLRHAYPPLKDIQIYVKLYEYIKIKQYFKY